MALHDFLTYQESVDRLGASESVRQAILSGTLRVYVELDEVTTIPLSIYEEGIGSGKTKFCSWEQKAHWHKAEDIQRGDYHTVCHPGEEREGVFAESVYYTLFGWFLLSRSDACRVARSHDETSRAISHLIAARDDGHESDDMPPWFEADVSIRLTALWFRKTDIESMSSATPIAEPSGTKTLGTRERNSYLRVILALAEMAELGEDLPTATGKVENKLEFLGLHEAGPKNTIIRKILTAAFALKPPPPKASK